MSGNPLSAVTRKFLTGHPSVIFIMFAVCAGIGSILMTPREEEPQIVVPVADIIVSFPGASPDEVENLVSAKLSNLLWQIDGVEYVYSASYRDFAVVTVRFFVGEDRERSLIKLYNRIQSNVDRASPGITGWVVKPLEIDDVPVISFSLHSAELSDHELHRIAEEAAERVATVSDISRIDVIGGRKREIRVELDTEAMSAKGVTPVQVYQALAVADSSVTAGTVNIGNQSFLVRSGPFFENAAEVGKCVVGLHEQRVVRLSDIAHVSDGPEEAASYTRIGFGRASDKFESRNSETLPSVTIAVSKKKGTNAVKVAQDVIAEMKRLERTVLPAGVAVTVSRNYGLTADIKVNELLTSLLSAIACVVILIAVSMGWREAIVVALAVPISFSLSLFVNLIFGYTINRVTLFALILSLGLVVDDPITNVDNIQRHMFMKKESPFDAVLTAVSEVLSPVIMSTLTIIVSFLPMFFITGMMGPYMAPMAVNVPLTVTFSTLCALTFVPWAAYHLLKTRAAGAEAKSSINRKVASVYSGMIRPFLHSDRRCWILFAVTGLLLVLSGMLVLLRLVPLKILPFDNKNEFQVLLDMPEGTTLEETDAAVRRLEGYLSGVNEVTEFYSFTGIPSPMDFNGMVRQYYFRTAPHFADIRVNLASKDRRKQQSHEIVLRLRK
ncbi:MAG: efflux RND transporter permease subunit, partial [Candidatus Wallbacteria bacterium]|nr:efflux RND transporter permease subunit [Candidatus Wallbacteria bacterium]